MDIEKILSRTVRTDSGCLLWTGAKNEAGYPLMKISEAGVKRMKGVARVVLEKKLGRPLAPDELANRSCGISACIEPSHLQAADAVEASRIRRMRNKEVRFPSDPDVARRYLDRSRSLALHYLRRACDLTRHLEDLRAGGCRLTARG